MGCRLNGLDHLFSKKKNSSRSNGCCNPFEKKFHPLKWPRLPFEKNLHPFERLRLSLQKKSAAVRLTDVIRLKETAVQTVQTTNVTHSRKYYSAVRMAAAISSHKTNQSFDWPRASDGIRPFEWLGLSVQKELYTTAQMAVFI